MFAIVFEQAIKWQNGLSYPRVEVDQRTHSGDKFGNFVLAYPVLSMEIPILKIIFLEEDLIYSKCDYFFTDKGGENW